MIEFEATYYDGVHPVGEPVAVLVTADGKTTIKGQEVSYTCNWLDIDVNTQLGQTARVLNLPNGAKCESIAHDRINRLQKKHSRAGSGRLLHALESRWQYVLIASLVVIGFTWAMITYGIPSLAKSVAFKLPVSVDEKLSEGSLIFLDKHILDPSQLEPNVQQRLQEKFAIMVRHTDDTHNYRLLFRSGIGPNAFALPSGHIVATDELVEMADADEEVLAVLAHEIGHVKHKHGLRSVLQSSTAALLLTAITGDIGTASGLAAAMPVLLLETKYSRKFELEADQYALDYMHSHGIDPKYFVSILEKITGENGDEESSFFNYLSTHPMTSERTRRFKDNALNEK